MSPYRILVVSNARPSRTWNFAERIAREIQDIEICGIVQAPTRDLPIEQRRIMNGGTNDSCTSGWLRKTRSWLRAIGEPAIHAALSCIHALPAEGLQCTNFTPAHLAENCRAKGIPFLTISSKNGSKIAAFAAERDPDFAIILGGQQVPNNLLAIPRRGWVLARQKVAQKRTMAGTEGSTITIKWISTDSRAFTLAQLTLPHQAYDTQVSMSLKADLISDDLAIESTRHISRGTAAEASAHLARFIEQIFSPYLQQLKRYPGASSVGQNFRWRRRWKLCLDTLLLCSPATIARNCYRRVRRNYPVTILTHHLVSDRAHRMGISTQRFWQQVRFLQRHYRIVNLAEAVELLKDGKVDVPTIVLTFDDGYADNFLALRAVAEETGIPVTMFVATEPVARQHEFQHDIENGIRGALPLTWEQLRYWSSGRIEVGAHTRTHFDCGSKDKSRLDSEIAGSKLDLQERLLKPVAFFAFPFGQPENMSAEALQIAGAHYPYFLSGFGGENRCGRARGPHLLRRNLYANSWELELELQGIFDIIDRIKRSLFPHKRRSAGSLERVPALLFAETSSAVPSQELTLIR